MNTLVTFDRYIHALHQLLLRSLHVRTYMARVVLSVSAVFLSARGVYLLYLENDHDSGVLILGLPFCSLPLFFLYSALIDQLTAIIGDDVESARRRSPSYATYIAQITKWRPWYVMMLIWLVAVAFAGNDYLIWYAVTAFACITSLLYLETCT